MSEDSRPSVCIVTGELVGPFKNGGIGTSMTGLAQCLAGAGFAVSVLYTGANVLSPVERQSWRVRFGKIGIDLDWLVDSPAEALGGLTAEMGFTTPYRVYRHLRDRHFNIIQFNDCLGDGYLCLAAKRMGIAFADSRLLVGLHSPSQWIFELNRQTPPGLLPSAFNYAERMSVRCADLLWSPSQYLLDWAADAGFHSPPETRVQQYVLPRALFGAPVSEARASEGKTIPAEIVFFGRIEERKGIRLFCAALTQLSDRLAARSVTVTFLGKYATVGTQGAERFLREQSRSWAFDWRAITDLSQPEAIAYFHRDRTLAVMASPADNSPCTVYEALEERLCFIAARTGGIPELIHPADRDAVLFDDDVAALAAKIEQALDSGIAPARPAYTQAKTRQRWIDLFATGASPVRPAEREAADRPWVALVDHAPGCDLAATVASLKRAPQFRRIVILNRDSPGAVDTVSGDAVVEAQPVKHLDLASALDVKPDDAVFMMHSGAVLAEAKLSVAVAALRCADLDGLLPAGLTGRVRTLVPLGGSQSVCFFTGVDQGGGVMVKGDRLARFLAVEPLPAEAPYANLADLCVAAGLELWPFPEPLLEQADEGAQERGLSVPERVQAYAGVGPVERFYIDTQALNERASAIGALEELYRRAARTRIGWLFARIRRAVPSRLVDRIRKRG